ncbi:allatostatin-A receptor-like [Acropora millepora]|uniref:allatostatin-A receptor-like n=1 Tax=Acropora millepora TaxID=45264 RepID=UPI001CF1E309|nr:allatostatin-A receptor-like [Acropora millepora]
MNNTTAIAGSNPTISHYGFTKAEGIAIFSAFIVACFFIVAGNFLTIVLFALTKKLRKKSLFLVMNMVVSDLLLEAVSLPVYIFLKGDFLGLFRKVKWNQYFDSSYIFVDAFLSQVSLITVVLISLERFHAICWPFRHRVLSMRTYKIEIFVTWTLAFFICSVIGALTWRGSRATLVSSHNRLNIESLTYTLLFVSFLALVCWIPLVIMNYFYFFCRISASWFFLIYEIANFLNYFNSCVNPMVYAYRVPEFRQASRLRCLDKRVEVVRSGAKNTASAFQAQNNHAMETEL